MQPGFPYRFLTPPAPFFFSRGLIGIIVVRAFLFPPPLLLTLRRLPPFDSR